MAAVWLGACQCAWPLLLARPSTSQASPSYAFSCRARAKANDKSAQLRTASLPPAARFMRRRVRRGLGVCAQKADTQNKSGLQEKPSTTGVEGASDDQPEQQPPIDVDWGAVALPFLFPAIGGLLFGFDIGATSGAVVSLKDATLSGTSWYQLSPFATGAVVSGSLVGALAGSILAFNVADFLGRRRELLASAALYAAGAALMFSADSLSVLVLGRCIYGVGIGLAMHAAPMYIAESCPSQVRGTLISLKECFIVAGILLGYVVGDVWVDTVGGWRYMLGAAFPIAALMGAGMATLPQSPRWLLLRASEGKAQLAEARDAAFQAVRRLRGPSASEAAVRAECDECEKSLTVEKTTQSAGWQELLQGSNKTALVIGSGLVLFQQITGQPSVLYYANQIFQQAGLKSVNDAAEASVALGVLKLAMTGVAVVTVDKLGRRPLLLAGIGGILVSLLILGTGYTFGGNGLDVSPLTSVAALLLYVSCYQISFGPISWLMVSEIFPLRVRSRALSIATLVNFSSNALVAFCLPPFEAAFGQGPTFYGFAGISLAALLFVATSVPETKGLSLEEIEASFVKKV